MPFYKNTFRVVDGVIVPGTSLHAFIKNGECFYLTDIEVFKDGMIECWGLASLKEFKAKVAEGWIRTSLTDGATVSMMLSSLRFNVASATSGVEETEFVKEVEDELARLNDLPTSATRCRRCLATYRKSRSKKNLAALREAYELVPKHLRRFLGNMDTRDAEYRKVLGLNSAGA